MAVIGDRVFMGRLASNFEDPRDPEGIRRRFAEQMEYKGYKRALISTMRHLMPLDFSPTFTQVGKQGRPVLLIWGTKDAVIPFAHSERVREAIPQVEFHPLEGRGHTLTLERPEIVNPILIDFFQR
jgi:pimeloyl-ACP methyl ester carboxylesterase